MFKLNYLKKNYFSLPVISLSLISVLMLSLSCISSKENNITFFGGKIKNPKAEYVYFFEGKKLIDSAKLDINNRFSFELDSIKIGLYHFWHGPEFQYLYLEPQDSLLIYLNTWDFDESLIFSGKGSAKNNYLINLYLEQEKNEKNFKNNYRLNEEEFSAVINNGIQDKLTKYNQLIESESDVPSEFFERLAKTGIYFPYYYIMEYYPFNHKWMLKLKDLPALSEEFYSYRKKINFNDETLLDYTPYTLFIKTHLYHLAYIERDLDREKSNIELNYMNLVKDKIHIESFKNRLLAGSLWKSLSANYLTVNEFNNLQNFFYNNCTDETYISELKKSVFQKEQFKKGDMLPKLVVYNTNGNEVSINDITKNNIAVIYFWPKELGKIEMLHEKLIILKKEYPNVLFIGIERNKNQSDWKGFIESKHLAKNKQFNLSKSSENYSWFEGNTARTIIINDQGNVENAYLFFNNKYFENHLKKFKKH